MPISWVSSRRRTQTAPKLWLDWLACQIHLKWILQAFYKERQEIITKDSIRYVTVKANTENWNLPKNKVLRINHQFSHHGGVCILNFTFLVEYHSIHPVFKLSRRVVLLRAVTHDLPERVLTPIFWAHIWGAWFSTSESTSVHLLTPLRNILNMI